MNSEKPIETIHYPLIQSTEMNSTEMNDYIMCGGLAVFGSKEILNKILGPTAEYIGSEMRNLTERCNVNVNLNRVFESAWRRLGKRADRDGIVSPRVLKRLLDEARFCEDTIVAEYLGGVLASSKTTTNRDDRAITYLSILGELSAYQIRTHYLLCTALFSLPDILDPNNRYWFDNDLLTIYISDDAYAAAMDFGHSEDRDTLSRHAFLGLEMKRLSEGGIDIIPDFKERNWTEPFRHFYPTKYGIELFLWGMGLGGADLNLSLKEELDTRLIPNLGLSALGFDSNKIYIGHPRRRNSA